MVDNEHNVPTQESVTTPGGNTPHMVGVVSRCVAGALLVATLGTACSSAGDTKSDEPQVTQPRPANNATTTTVVDSTNASTTTVAGTPSTDPNGATNPTGETTHSATYRDGKLFLEGRISSQQLADQYISKASAILGPDNVINGYEIDPSVPVSKDGTVLVDEPLLFKPNSATIEEEFKSVLDLAVAALTVNENASGVIVGNTDSSGNTQDNLFLSAARARAVADYMESKGIAPARLQASGIGSGNPIASNDTPEGRALNRRIDFKLINILGD